MKRADTKERPDAALPRVSLVHLGCARNLIDSELILARLAEQGLVVTDDPAEAHTVVLNTCSFIGPAREESYGAMRELLARKARGEISGVVVAGCLVQRYKRALTQEFPDVDVFAEISDYRSLALEVRRLVRGSRFERYLQSPGLREPEREDSRLLSTPGSYAYLRISHGCDHTCAFCAIPSIRGPHRSKRPEAVLEEARELVDAGVRELVLVAEDSTAWGRDLGSSLPALVRALADLEGPHRVRVMYAYPNRFPWELTSLLAEHPRVVPYLDIPIQHVSTRVLRAMRRAGSGDAVRRILDRLRDEVPGITLRSTVLVGFPGEREKDVEELAAFVREYRIGRLGAFTWSAEEGTSGYELPERVPPAEAEARRDAVLAVRDEVLAEGQQALVGRTMEVLVDEPAGPDGRCVARGDSDAPEVDLSARVAGAGLEVGERVRVRVEGVEPTLDLACRTV